MKGIRKSPPPKKIDENNLQQQENTPPNGLDRFITLFFMHMIDRFASSSLNNVALYLFNKCFT